MALAYKKIGIIGYGIVGRSLHNFFKKKLSGATYTIFDQKYSTPLYLQEDSFLPYDQDTILTLCKSFDGIFISPSIDPSPFIQYQDIFITELDIFYHFFKKPIIAVTGSVGKTSSTLLIDTFLRSAGFKTCIGGNIGIGLCDLIEQSENIDYAVIEVSSFQLEFIKYFTPTLGVITNIYPNHLDRHKTLAAYAAIKMKIFSFQTKASQAVIHNSALPFVTDNILRERVQIYDTHISLEKLPKGLPTGLMPENIALAIKVLATLKIPLPKTFLQLSLPEHRMEYVDTITGISFYNDSKSTLTESTIAAVRSCAQPPIVLIGGISKGVCRNRLIGALAPLVKHMIFFGAEYLQLAEYAQFHTSAYNAFKTMDEAFNCAVTIASINDIVLFSPSGASFDQFANYQDRGKRFKELVHIYKTIQSD